MQIQKVCERWIIVNDDGTRVSTWYTTEDQAREALEAANQQEFADKQEYLRRGVI